MSTLSSHTPSNSSTRCESGRAAESDQAAQGVRAAAVYLVVKHGIASADAPEPVTARPPSHAPALRPPLRRLLGESAQRHQRHRPPAGTARHAPLYFIPDRTSRKKK